MSGVETEGPWALPEGWCWARLDTVAAVNPSTSFDTLKADTQVPFVPMAAVAEETGVIELSARRQVRDVAKGYVRFMEGDVIFAKITPCMENGKVAPVVGLPGRYAAGSTEFHVFRPLAVDQRHLWYWLVGRSFRGRAKRNMSGSAGQLRVPVDYLRESLFPLAPLAEQRRIAARIDALFAEVSDGEAALAAARKGLETFRRALLKAAVSGELTKDWREANPPTETGGDLLARIAKARAAGHRMRSSGEVRPLDADTQAELPEGWAWGTVDEVADVFGGLTKNPEREKFGEQAPYLRVANVQMGRLDLAEMKMIGVTAGDRERAALAFGDVLVVEGNGSVDQIGRCAVWRDEIPGCVHQNHIIKVRAKEPWLSEWLLTWLLSPSGRRAIERVASSTSGLHTLSISKIAMLPVPVVRQSEAAEILRRVSDALAAVADAQALLDAEAADAARLRQSILKAAFAGRLVAQDPKDEPASVLLARLSNSSSPAAKRGRGRLSKIAS
jgi:type I restriction enzyme S subunit